MENRDDPRDDDLDGADDADVDAREGEERDASRGKGRRLDSIVPDALRRAIERGIEAGLGTLTKTDDVLRGVVGEVKLPKEVVGQVLSSVDDTKNAMLKAVAGEVRQFLTETDLASELRKVLTSLSFEIKTEIRFIPNDAGEGVRPDVKMATTVHTDNGETSTGRPSASARRVLRRRGSGKPQS